MSKLKWTIASLGACLVVSAPSFADNASTGAAPAWKPSPGDVIAFDVLRQGNEFGSHVVRFSETSDGSLEVEVDVDLKAGLGPITLFRYELDATETWKDGKLVALEGRVNDDGTREGVRAKSEGNSLVVDGDGYTGEVAPDILPASHWNVAQTTAQRLLSSENGELIDVTVRSLGRETIEAGGKSVVANKYLMDSDIDVTLWYDDAGRWLKLAFEARGQSIEYVLKDNY